MWAIDVASPLNDDDNSVVLNAYGLANAHKQMYQMLTGTTPANRSLATERLFEDLGHMVHLVQDMGQPEHTRNDQHLSLFGWGLTGLPIKSAASIYENWTRDNVALRQFIPSDVAANTTTESLFIGYPAIRFSDYHTYFTNGTAGLADYASNNHVTQDTNYHDNSFHCLAHQSPALSSAIPRQESIHITLTDPITQQAESLSVPVTVYSLSFQDYAKGEPNVDGYHAFESFFNYETKKYDTTATVFSLSDNSWFSRALNLLPKTVGYSAGMIQRFFRGRIASSWFQQNDGTYTVHVINVTPFRYADLLTNCTVELYKTNSDGDLQLLASAPALASCQDDTVVATNVVSDPADPLYKHELRAVVRGDLGTEKGAVIGEILPKKHELKLVYQYNPNIADQTNSLLLATTDWENQIEEGWFSCTTRCVGTTVYSGGNMQFASALQPPFNGTFQITVAVADTDVFYGEVNLHPFTDFSTPQTGILTIYRDGEQVNQMTFSGLPASPYAFRIDFKMDSSGNISNLYRYDSRHGAAGE